VFFGLQYLLKKYLQGEVITQAAIEYAQERIRKHLGAGLFNREGWDYILNVHDGRLPVSVWAIPEGTPVPTGHPLMVVENMDPECWWLTNYLETLLMRCFNS